MDARPGRQRPAATARGRLAPRGRMGFVVAAMLLTACGGVGTTAQRGSPPDGLALTEERLASRTDPAAASPGAITVEEPTTTTRSALPSSGWHETRPELPRHSLTPIPLGDSTNPFAPLPEPPQPLAVMTETGVVAPVLEERGAGWLVGTPCQSVRLVADATPIGRAHIVLDPGHGGSAVGATGPSGLRESDLNLEVARRSAEILGQAGATVILTRGGDYTMTAAARGRLARAIQPALLVSVHHNGGAPPTGDRPGTLVYTKTGSPASTRFGGLFHQVMQPMLQAAAEPKRLAYAAYAETLDAYEAQVAAYDQSVAARDAALVANGQLPPDGVTAVPTTMPVAPGQFRLPSVRETPTTTTTPASADPTVPVPDSLPIPPPLTVEPVREFRWAGSGNAGVRSWTRADGLDYLAVLRHSGDVPAVLAEFLYVTNPSEEELLSDPAFIEKEAGALADAIILYFSTEGEGTGFVADQFDDQPIGGGGGISGCVEPPL